MGSPLFLGLEFYDLSFQKFTTLRLVHTTLSLTCRLDRIYLSYHIMLYFHNIDTNAEQVSKQCHMDLRYTYVPSFLELGFIIVCLSQL